MEDYTAEKIVGEPVEKAVYTDNVLPRVGQEVK